MIRYQLKEVAMFDNYELKSTPLYMLIIFLTLYHELTIKAMVFIKNFKFVNNAE